MPSYARRSKQVHPSIMDFAAAGGIRLRGYQQAVAQAVLDSVFSKKGLTLVVMFPRQSGKNELQAQLEAYLLIMGYKDGREMVKVSPTWKPQSLNAMHRLEKVLRSNPWAKGRWERRNGYIFQADNARLTFLSGEPSANVVGATASTLLECDEAQDVSLAKWDGEFAPMAASTNATRVFWGTAWTSTTLLGRELRLARQAEQQDGKRCVFTLEAGQVADEVPAYGRYVQEQVSRLGRQHPLIKTQYYSEEIDAESGMFTVHRRALMQGSHAALERPQAGSLYALTLDVAGEDEGLSGEAGALENPQRDSTALTVFELDGSSLALCGKPTYRVVQRYAWTGTRHASLYGQLNSLVELWQPVRLVVDATGVGAGLAAFLRQRWGERVLPFAFTSLSKSKLGWDFLALVETGRYKDHQPQPGDTLSLRFWREVAACQMAVQEGPRRLMQWGVPQGKRDALSGELVHDDLLVSAALCAALDELPWGEARSAVAGMVDPLHGLGEVF